MGENKQSIKAIIFQLEDEEYAVSVHDVDSIERMQPITRVPQTDEFVKGVINLRGVITPVIDLRKRFSIEESLITDRTRIMIVNVNQLHVGIIVDAAYDVVDIPTDSIEPPQEVVGTVDVNYIDGVVKLEDRLIILLNMEKVLEKNQLNDLLGIEG